MTSHKCSVLWYNWNTTEMYLFSVFYVIYTIQMVKFKLVYIHCNKKNLILYWLVIKLHIFSWTAAQSKNLYCSLMVEHQSWSNESSEFKSQQLHDLKEATKLNNLYMKQFCCATKLNNLYMKQFCCGELSYLNTYYIFVKASSENILLPVPFSKAFIIAQHW